MKLSIYNFLLILLVSVLPLVGCKKETPKVGILVHSYDDKDKSYLIESLKRMGAEVLVKEADNNQEAQIDQVDEMLNNGAKVLIIVSINQENSAKIVELAHKKNSKVIAYDRLINGCQLDYFVSSNSLDYYVSTDTKKIGEMQAEYMTSICPSGDYALICGSKYDNNSMRLFNGEMSVLQPLMESGNIQLLYSEFTDDWTEEQGAFHAAQILDRFPEIDAIIAGNDALARGVISTLKQRGLDGKVLVAGLDADLENVNAIIKGKQACTVLKPLKEMAEATAEIAVSIAFDRALTISLTNQSNGKALIKSVMIDATLVNKDNIKSTILNSGYYTSAQINR